MAQSPINNVLKLYKSIIDHVISEVRDSFLDEGVDEQVLQELKQIWESKLTNSKAVEIEIEREPQPPVLIQHKQAKVLTPVVQPNTQVIKKPGGFHASGQTIMGQQMQQHTQIVQQQQPNQIQQPTQAAQQPQSVPQTIQQLALDPNRQVPLQITLPAPAGSFENQSRVLTIQVPASALAGNALQSILTGPVISATMALPHNVAASLLQQHVNAALQGQASSTAGIQVNQQPQVQVPQAPPAPTPQTQQGFGGIRQLDGGLDSSDDDDDDADDDDDDEDEADEDKDEDENEEENEGGQEEEPLNSEDDVSDEDPQELFETDNVVVCQYDKITRTRNKWKFYLKDGIMNLGGKDYVFQKASGDAEW